VKRRPWLCLALAALGGCGELGPDYGEATDAGTAACGLKDSDPDTPVSWAEIKGEILAKRCGCHMTPAGFGATVGGLLLADRGSAGVTRRPGAKMPRAPSRPERPATATWSRRRARRRLSARACP
jgi:hypothetical protein